MTATWLAVTRHSVLARVVAPGLETRALYYAGLVHFRWVITLPLVLDSVSGLGVEQVEVIGAERDADHIALFLA